MSESYAMTVRGPVPISELGLVLPHEHLFANTLREYRSEGLLDDEGVALRALNDFREAGGGAVIDVTPSELGRRPAALKRLAQESGVHIIAGCGHYRDPYLDRRYFDAHRTTEIADNIIREIYDGIDGTDVRPGIIGEIGADSAVVSAVEERSLRAAGIAQRETGLAITLHAARTTVGCDMLRILDSERVPRDRVVVGHLDTVRDYPYVLELAQSGSMLEFDGFSATNEHETSRTLRVLIDLIDRGFAKQVLVSHDAFLTSHFAEFGGAGLVRLPNDILPRLRAQGVSSAVIDEITVRNPQRVLALR